MFGERSKKVLALIGIKKSEGIPREITEQKKCARRKLSFPQVSENQFNALERETEGLLATLRVPFGNIENIWNRRVNRLCNVQLTDTDDFRQSAQSPLIPYEPDEDLKNVIGNYVVDDENFLMRETPSQNDESAQLAAEPISILSSSEDSEAEKSSPPNSPGNSLKSCEKHFSEPSVSYLNSPDNNTPTSPSSNLNLLNYSDPNSPLLERSYSNCSNSNESPHSFSACTPTSNIISPCPLTCSVSYSNSSLSLSPEDEVASNSPANDSVIKEPKTRRKNFCLFCEKLVTNFVRHLLAVHKNEIDVLKISNLPKQSSERRMLSETLRKRGNFIYSSSTEGKLLLQRRSFKTLSPTKEDVVFCKFCNGLYIKRALFRHLQWCPKNDSNKEKCKYCAKEFKKPIIRTHIKFCKKEKGITSENEGEEKNTSNSNCKRQNRVLTAASISASPQPLGASPDLFNNVLNIIRDDELGKIAKTDPLILAVGSRLRANHREDHLKTYVSIRMRDLARIVAEMKKKKTTINSLESCLMSENVNLLINCIQSICGYKEETGEVKIPSMPSRIGPSIHLAFNIIINELNLRNDLIYEEKKRITFDYKASQNTLRIEWRFTVSTNAEKCRKENHRNKEDVLPLEEDVQTALKFLTEKESTLYKELKKKPSLVLYEQMCEALIADIIIFNCRRAGEAARILLKHYLDRDKSAYNKNWDSMFSEQELHARENTTMFEIPGKRDNNVYVFLTHTMKKCIDLLICLRAEFPSVDPDSKYLFVRPYSDKPFSGCLIISKLKNQLVLKKPEYFTSTGLRHELSSTSKVKNKDPKYTGRLCTHLGHKKSIHEQNYQLPMRVVQHSTIGATLLNRREGDIVNSNCKSAEQSGVPMLIEQDDFSIDPDDPASPTRDGEIGEADFLPPPHKMKDRIYNIDEDFNTINVDKEGIKSNDDRQQSSRQKGATEKIEKTCSKQRNSPWSQAEKAVIVKHFSSFFNAPKNPGKLHCCQVLQQEPVLRNRTWAQVNAFVNNIRKNKLLKPIA